MMSIQKPARETITNLYPNPTFEGPVIPSGASYSGLWSYGSKGSLRVPPASSANLLTLSNQTLVIVPRFSGQRLRLGGSIRTATVSNRPMRVQGTGLIELLEGWWSLATVVAGDYHGPPFSGELARLEYQGQMVQSSWLGEPLNSASSFDYYNVEPWTPDRRWDAPTERRYTLGVDRGMLYVDSVGYGWSGLVTVDRQNDGGGVAKRYIDGRLFTVIVPPSDYVANLEAYTYPDVFDECLGNVRPDNPGFIAHGQPARPFDLCYRTLVGDAEGHFRDYKLHLVYNVMAQEGGHTHATISDSPEAETFGFEIHGVPVASSGLKPTAYFSIDTREVNHAIVQTLEKVLYGWNETQPRLPSIEEIRSYLNS